MNKAAFLDRDGIINRDFGYVYQAENFEFMPGIFDLCTRLQEQGYLLIVVTNQSGIGRGKYATSDFEQVTAWMTQEFLEQGVNIDAVYHCPHHATAGQGEYAKACHWRKPEPGMLLKAKDDFNLNMEQSIILGDKISDLQAGQNAGVGQGFLLGESSQAMQTLSMPSVAIQSLEQVVARLP